MYAASFTKLSTSNALQSQSFSQGRTDETALPTYSCNSIDTRNTINRSCHVTGLDSYDNDSDRNLTSNVNNTTQQRPESCNCDSESRLHWQHHPPPSSRCHTGWPPGWYRCQRCPNSCFAIASSRSLSYLGIGHWFCMVRWQHVWTMKLHLTTWVKIENGAWCDERMMLSSQCRQSHLWQR